MLNWLNCTRKPRPWYQDLCDYYNVSPEQAHELGKRSDGRRPDLPGSETTHAVSGKTFEDLWNQKERISDEDVFGFYQEIGSWAAFRQVVRHKGKAFHYLVEQIKSGDHICEYGSGVSPVSYWLIEHFQRKQLHFTIVDVPCEHLTFGEWRLRRQIDHFRSKSTVEKKEIQAGSLPLEAEYDLILILEVFEHLPNPLEVAKHLLGHLKAGGYFWENYISQDADHANLSAAQQEREAVFQLLNETCIRICGKDPSTPGGGDNRCWQKR